jgi:hypothetical protein
MLFQRGETFLIVQIPPFSKADLGRFLLSLQPHSNYCGLRYTPVNNPGVIPGNPRESAKGQISLRLKRGGDRNPGK